MKKKSESGNEFGEQLRRAFDRRAGEALDLSREEIFSNVARAIGITPERLHEIWELPDPKTKEFRPGINQGNGFAAVELRLRLTLKWEKI